MVPNGTAYSNYPPFANNGTKTPPGGSTESAKYALGMVPADTFPAEWANYLFHGATQGITRLNQDTGSIKKEINTVLSDFNINPDATLFNQLLTAMRLNASFITATSTTITGPLLVSGGTIRVMFTAAIAGNNTTTGLMLSYNSRNIPVKVYKDGNLESFTAAKISWQDANIVYRYLDAGTALELLYDGAQFIIVNNPIVLKSIRHTIYADGTVGGGNIASIKPSFTDTLDYGWLACEHQSLLRTDYPKLFSYFQTHKIGSNTMLEVFGAEDSEHFYLPDTREVALVGAGQNDSDTIETHDVYTVGQFADDRLQRIWNEGFGETTEKIPAKATVATLASGPYGYYVGNNQLTLLSTRFGNTTRGKRKGVKFLIKIL